MEELLELREFIREGNYAGALELIGKMEEMSKDDKINTIGSYIEIDESKIKKESFELILRGR